jgi:hypothetical protein
MKRMLVCLTLLLAFKSCQKAPQNARDTAAALKGALVTAQQQYQSECQKTPSESYCQTINRAVAAQNALITATELYCGWATSGPPTDPNSSCVPVSSFQQTLESALANANQAIKDIKGILKP